MTIDWSKAPEGATHYDPVDQNFLREVGPALLMYRINVGWVVPHQRQYAHTVEDTLRPLMIRPAWNGEGLPPVGTVCEIRHEKFGWTRCEIVAHKHMSCGGKSHAIAWIDGDHVDQSQGTRFRPIRTAKQIAEDQKKQEVQELMIILGSVESAAYKDIAIAIQQANFRKQVSQ